MRPDPHPDDCISDAMPNRPDTDGHPYGPQVVMAGQLLEPQRIVRRIFDK
jgi:hypothetical protein